MKNSINRNILAQGYSQIVTFAIQLGTVPFLVTAWGVERYGVWLILTAIPAYLALTDFGFTFIAKNDMAMRVAGGDKNGALVTYQSVFALLIGICAVCAVLLFSSVFFLPLKEWFNFGNESIEDIRWVLIFQFSSVFIYQFFLLFCSGIRCEGMFATESTLAASSRLIEALSIVTIALCGGGVFEAALGALITKLIVVLSTGVWLHTKVKWLKLGFSNVRINNIKQLAGPSMSYMLVPISNALMIQAPLVILGAFSTPVAVALFSITRTVARLGMSGANMLAYAFTPVYSRAWGSKNKIEFYRAINKHRNLFLIGFVLYLLISIPFSSELVSIISKQHILPSMILCLIMTIGVSLEMVWNSLFTPLIALNVHRRLPVVLLFTSVFSISLGVKFPNPIDLSILIFISHLIILIVVVNAFRQTAIFKEESA